MQAPISYVKSSMITMCVIKKIKKITWFTEAISKISESYCRV